MASEAEKREKLQRAFGLHYTAVSRYCHRRLQADEANDAAAQTFVVAWKKIDKMPEVTAALPWLYTIARYEVSNRRRSSRRFGRLVSKLSGLGPHIDESPEERVIGRIDSAGVLRALATLSERDQEVIRLRAFEELSIAEVAAVVGCSPEAAKKRCARALQRMRGALDTPSPDRRPAAREEEA